MTIICLLAASLTLDYATPAGCWNEALPLGNGRLGAMVFGGAGMERIQLNEDTLWAGGPNNALEPRMRDVLPEARRRILSGEAEEAYEWLANRDFGTSKNGNSFAYQTLGSLMMKFEGHDFPRNYRRTLSLDEAIATLRPAGAWPGESRFGRGFATETTRIACLRTSCLRRTPRWAEPTREEHIQTSLTRIRRSRLTATSGAARQ